MITDNSTHRFAQIAVVAPNGRGGWDLRLPGKEAIGNYDSATKAATVSLLNGYDVKISNTPFETGEETARGAPETMDDDPDTLSPEMAAVVEERLAHPGPTKTLEEVARELGVELGGKGENR